MSDHRVHPETLAGDPFPAAALKSDDEHPHACTDGWVFIGIADEDGEEHEAVYRCQRCAAEADA